MPRWTFQGSNAHSRLASFDLANHEENCLLGTKDYRQFIVCVCVCVPERNIIVCLEEACRGKCIL